MYSSQHCLDEYKTRDFPFDRLFLRITIVSLIFPHDSFK